MQKNSHLVTTPPFRESKSPRAYGGSVTVTHLSRPVLKERKMAIPVPCSGCGTMHNPKRECTGCGLDSVGYPKRVWVTSNDKLFDTRSEAMIEEVSQIQSSEDKGKK